VQVQADESVEYDEDELLRLAMDHGRLVAKVGTLSSQLRDVRGALKRVLDATDRHSDSRRAPWWLEAHRALRRSAGA
jgi:hypothetical protein